MLKEDKGENELRIFTGKVDNFYIRIYHFPMRFTLRSKTITVFLLALSIAMAVILLSGYYLTIDQNMDEYIRYNTTILGLEAYSIEFHLNQILQSSLAFYRNDNLMEILRGTQGRYGSSEQIRRELFTVLNSSPYITQVHLYSHVLGMEYVVRGSSTAQAMADTGVPENPIPYNKVTIDGQTTPDYGFPVNMQKDESVITMSRSIYDFPGNRYLGQIDIDMNLDYFRSLASALSEYEILAFVANNGDILYSSGDAAVIRTLLDPAAADDSSSLLPKKYIALSADVMPNGFVREYRLIQAIPEEAVTATARGIARSNLGIGVAISFIAMLILARILSGYTMPFGYIENQLKKISEGNLDVKMDIRDNTEFTGLARQFNEMIDSINNLIISGYKLEISNKNYQLKALQAQMDPHFINNALQNIGAEALKKGNRELYYSVMQFGEMMRYTMDFQSLMVPLSDDLKYAVNYLNLQTMRFKDKFTYSISAEDETMSIMIPKLLLQPLVENVFKHGQNTDGRTICIRITTALDHGTLRLECSNDGRGLAESELRELQEMIIKARESEEESRHIGLINLSRRLFIVYGDRSSIEIDSGLETGFTVRIEIRETAE